MFVVDGLFDSDSYLSYHQDKDETWLDARIEFEEWYKAHLQLQLSLAKEAVRRNAEGGTLCRY